LRSYSEEKVATPVEKAENTVLCPEGDMWKFGKKMGKVKKECNVE
jgi:hypothetical protein